MAVFVGDILMDVRRRVPDLPAVMGAPSNFTIGSSGSGGTLPAATYYVVVTALNSYGETLATSEQNTGALGGSTNQISATTTALQQPLGATYIRMYVGTTTGVYFGFVQAAVTTGASTTVTATGLSSLTMGTPPSQSSAYLPDTDGGFVTCQQIFSMLNRGMVEMVRICGGVVDTTGIQAINAQAMYRTPGAFYQFTNAWFDGYPLSIVPRRMIFQRQSVPGFSGLMSYEEDGPQSVLNFWPQPNRTGQTSTVSIAMGATDSVINLANSTDASGFLGLGMVQVDQEVMSYSSVSGAQLLGVTRGLGGTDIGTHGINAAVTELNIRLSGRRMARTYNAGDSAQVLNVPLGWEAVVPLYILSEIRSMEQDDATAQKLMSDFMAGAEKIAKASRLGQIKPRQIQPGGAEGLDTYNQHIGGGWLVN